MKRILMFIFLSLLILYLGDYVAISYPLPKGREQFGVVKIRRYYAVGLKNRKTEYMFLDPETRVCVHSLFPHFGDPPCWYLTRRNVKRVDI